MKEKSLYFLNQVAHDLSQNSAEFTDSLILFPNKRAAIFFNQYLYQELKRAFFTPKYTTISEFATQYSHLQLADELTLVTELYPVFTKYFYKNKTKAEIETFDHFYNWGKTILQDFDDIDKNLVDASSLFKNMNDYQTIDSQFDFLTKEQKKILSHFFKACGENTTQLNRKFTEIWNCLADIYTEYKKQLSLKNKAYSGMLYRELYENIETIQFPKETHIFIIGFNVLNKVEQSIFKWLKSNFKTSFYWDYDDYYLDNEMMEAGLFMRENIKLFPSSANFKFNHNRIRENDQNIQLISASSEHAQTGFLKSFFENIPSDIQQYDIAIILGNENLLPGVLANLPDKIGQETTRVNITMGYPFQATALYNLIESYLLYQNDITAHSKTFSARLIKLLPFLEHNYWQFMGADYLKLIDNLKSNRLFYLKKDDLKTFDFKELLYEKTTPEDLLNALFEILKRISLGNVLKETKGKNGIENVLSETIYRAYTKLNILKDIISETSLDMSTSLLNSIILKELQSLKVPFEGDPINGIQIMGLLESRNLDFKEVLVLSSSDDFFPNVSSETSFIPFSIRKAYQLNTLDRKIAVFAYYFYRLFHCSKHLSFVYNNNTVATKKKELSRFLQQIRIESSKTINYFNLSAPMFTESEKHPSFTAKNEISRTEKHHQLIKKYAEDGILKYGMQNNYISPTYLNTYLDCERRFYFKYIARIESADIFTDDLQANDFGNVFHYAAKQIYQNILDEIGKNTEITSKDIKKYIDNPNLLKKIIIIEYQYFVLKKDRNKINPETVVLNEIEHIHCNVIYSYIIQLLELDAQYAPFRILGLETNVYKNIILKINNIDQKINISGQIDRIDYKDNVIRIVDYKTGGSNTPTDNKVDYIDLFALNLPNNKSKHRAKYVFQILIYAWMLKDNLEIWNSLKIDKIQPFLLYINKVKKGEEYKSPIVMEINQKNQIVDDYVKEVDTDFDKYLKEFLQKFIDSNNNSYHCRKFPDNCKYCDYQIFCP